MIATAKSPIGKLPTEIICAIVDTGRHPSHTTSTIFPILASHICHRWRDVVLHTPSLWCQLDLLPKSNPALHAALITRSQSSLVGVTLTIDAHPVPVIAFKPMFGSLPRGFPKSFGIPASRHLDIIERVAPRMRSLHIIVGAVQTLPGSAFARLQRLHVPKLVYFGIHTEPMTVLVPPAPNSATIPLFEGGAPLLRHLQLVSPLMAGMPMQHLISLTIRRSKDEPAFTFEQLQKILTASPTLECLTFEGAILNPEAEEERFPLRLPQLTKLQVELDKESGHDSLLELLDTPNLRTLSLLGLEEQCTLAVGEPAVRGLLKACRMHGCAPRALHLQVEPSSAM